MFAFENDEGFVPDILCLSKTLGCGLPLSSVSTTAEIEQRANEAGFLWLSTHFNDPLPAAVGDKVLEIVERDGICQRAAERGDQLFGGLLALQKKYWCIGDVRGRGLLQGVEIISDPKAKASGSALGQAVSERALARDWVEPAREALRRREFLLANLRSHGGARPTRFVPRRSPGSRPGIREYLVTHLSTS